MADLPAFESPIVKDYDQTATDLSLCDESDAARIILRADPDSPAARQLGVPFGAGRHDGEVLVCGLRPDEWLLLGASGALQSFAGAIDRTGHVSIIDHTHCTALFRLTGNSATATLEKVCSLDWNDSMTPNGACVSASVAKVTCDIVRNDLSGTPSYLIACDRSFGQYLFDAFLDAGNEFGIGISCYR